MTDHRTSSAKVSIRVFASFRVSPSLSSIFRNITMGRPVPHRHRTTISSAYRTIRAPVDIPQHHCSGSPALDCLSSTTCHPCYPGRFHGLLLCQLETYDPLLPRRRSLELPGRIGQFPGRGLNPHDNSGCPIFWLVLKGALLCFLLDGFIEKAYL